MEWAIQTLHVYAPARAHSVKCNKLTIQKVCPTKQISQMSELNLL